MRISAILLIALLALCFTQAVPASATSYAFPEPPRMMLWAWESPQNLKFIDVNKIGVAGLVQTIRLNGDKAQVYRRQQSMILAPNTYFVAVTRVEIDPRSKPDLSGKQLEAIRSRVVLSAAHAQEVQIDFDARVSERAFYARLIRAVRKDLPASTPLSITALSSWVLGDPWLNDLIFTPVSEVVPMFFQMGADRQNILQRMQKDGALAPTASRLALGVSIAEPDSAQAVLHSARNNDPKTRIYFFSARTWTPKTVRLAENWLNDHQASPTQIHPAQ